MIDGKVISILGKRGQGKTLLAEKLFSTAKKLSFFVSIRKPVIFKNQVITSFKQFLKYKNKHIYFLINDDNTFIILLKVLSKYTNFNIFIDEVDFFLNVKECKEIIEYFIKYTRTQSINVIMICRRPQESNPLLLSQTDLLICFQLSNIRDLDYIQKSYSLDNEIIQRIIHLPQYNFITIGHKDILNSI